MRISRILLAWGALVLGSLAYAHYTGWSMASYDEVKNLPKSLRENPGAYRSHYTRYFHK
jgi:hypothetical protein